MKKFTNKSVGWKTNSCFLVLIAALVVAWSVGAQSKKSGDELNETSIAGDETSVSNRGSNDDWDYKLTEVVQFKVINGVSRPQFALVYRNPPNTSVGDQLSFTADVTGVNKRGDAASGTMHGSCIATGVEQRAVPTCPRPNPDGTCAGPLDPLSPLFLCQQVFRLNDPQRGIGGISQLTIQGFVRQLEAAGDPPGQGQRSQYLAITGGTGRFEGASGMIKYDLRDNPAPPPIKDLEIYVKQR